MYEIEIEGLKELQGIFTEAPIIVGEELQKATMEAGLKIQSLEMKNSPHDTGNLARGIHLDYQPIQVTIAPQANYASYPEFGTQPHYVSPQQLMGWARRHGLNPYAVSKSIQKHGTKAQYYVRNTVGQIGEEVSEIFTNCLGNIIKRLSTGK